MLLIINLIKVWHIFCKSHNNNFKIQVMKKMIFVLAMFLTAATTYTQTSRKPANNNTAMDTKENATNHSRVSSGTNHASFTANSRGSESTSATNFVRNEQTTPQQNITRNNNTQKPSGRENTTQKPNSRETNTVERHQNGTNANATDRRNNNVRTENSNPNSGHSRESTHRPNGNQSRVVEYESPRVYRDQHRVTHQYHNPPATREYRSVHYVYRRPVHYEVYWTPEIHRHFIEIYPMVHYWNYYDGYRINTISAYDAMYYRGDVMTVYGEVFEVYYSRQTDEYFLYFGAYYPYQDFTVILPGYLAHKYSYQPERYFENRCIAVTGLITTFNGEPEIVVRESFQINMY
jgi:hypothetical protein